MGSDQKRFILAIVLSVLVLFLWQSFFAPKPVKKSSISSDSSITKSENGNERKSGQALENSISSNSKEGDVKTSSSLNSSSNENQERKELTLKTESFHFTFSNDFTLSGLKKFHDNVKLDYMDYFGSENAFLIRVVEGSRAKKVFFDKFELVNETKLSAFSSSLDLFFEAELFNNGEVVYSLKSSRELRYQIIFKSKAKELDNNQHRSYVFFDKELDRYTVEDEEFGEGVFDWIGFDFNYILFVMSFNNPSIMNYKMTSSGLLQSEFKNTQKELSGSFILVKKNYDKLLAFNKKLEKSVDFGFFGIIAVPILRALQFFYKYIPNYGVAIILVTLVIRLLTFPLQFKSFKSMKKMQKLQPEMAKLKEKYKNDPQKMQKETMALFKRAGANPLGGCFPILLQMPIFFALYRVIYEAVELVGAPFCLWITDLSLKDPYYVLPILMGASFFLQQKLTPSTTADPTQKKMMMIIPLIFPFIMKDFPAGLNLYILTSTILGVTQQIFVYKTVD